MAARERTRDTRWATPRGDDRRSAILRELRQLLESRPLSDVSVGEVSSRAGVSRSAFYFYFPSKEAAVLALLDDVRERMLRLARTWYDGGPGTPEQRLREGFSATIATWRRNPRWTVALLDAARANPEVAELRAADVARYAERVAERIEKDAGPSLRAEGAPSAAGLATALVALFFEMMERDARAVHAGEPGIEELEDQIVHIWLRSIYS